MLLGMGHPYYQAVSGIKEDVAVLLLGGNPALQGGGGVHENWKHGVSGQVSKSGVSRLTSGAVTMGCLSWCCNKDVDGSISLLVQGSSLHGCQLFGGNSVITKLGGPSSLNSRV